ncbi:MAG: hypothetical protein CMC79_02490 [Flavobacteriaceae bacterium]|nr:hypothetical protein [Flavobacteriaceae bacterium]|tara:strand:- start:50591 stop:51172 length:582 start_codon:yes stop_codon:yes gene_type:complete
MKKLIAIFALAGLIFSSCDTKVETKVEWGGPSDEDNATFSKQIETYGTFRQGFNEENMEMLMGTMADSLKWSPAWYNENKILGYDDLKSQLQEYFNQFDNITFAEGEGLVNPNAPAFWAGSHYSSGENMASSSPSIMRVYGTWSATHSESGAKVFNKYYGVLNFNSDGKIAEISDWMDISGMQAQIENHLANK